MCSRYSYGKFSQLKPKLRPNEPGVERRVVNFDFSILSNPQIMEREGGSAPATNPMKTYGGQPL